MAEFKIKTGTTIEQLQKRYQILNTAKITAEADYKNAKERLDSLKADAKKLYETDDLEALRAKFKEMESENARKLAEYQTHLDEIEKNLKEVNLKFNPQGGGT